MTNEKHITHRSRAAPVEVDPPRLDWPRIIRDVLNAGCSRYRLAALLGVGVSTVQSWEHMTGRRDIRYGFGRAILRVHSRYCGSALTFQRITEGDYTAYTSRA